MYNQEEIKKQLLNAIEQEECTSLSEASLYVAPTLATLYEWQFEKSEDIKKALDLQKIKVKAGMRKNWKKEDAAPVLQLAAYKLIADDEELEKLTVNNNNNRNSGELAITWNEVKTYETK